jgi:hypothetical protein
MASYNGSTLRKTIYDSHNEQQILDEVERFFENLLAAPRVTGRKPHPSLRGPVL